MRPLSWHLPLRMPLCPDLTRAKAVVNVSWFCCFGIVPASRGAAVCRLARVLFYISRLLWLSLKIFKASETGMLWPIACLSTMLFPSVASKIGWGITQSPKMKTFYPPVFSPRNKFFQNSMSVPLSLAMFGEWSVDSSCEINPYHVCWRECLPSFLLSEAL